MKYDVRLSRRAIKNFDALPRSIQERINHAFNEIADNPRGHQSKKLHGPGNLYRWRVGSWRIVYAVDDAIQQAMITIIAHRRNVYR